VVVRPSWGTAHPDAILFWVSIEDDLEEEPADPTEGPEQGEAAGESPSWEPLHADAWEFWAQFE
jgi:hypothetical protein